MRKQPGRGSPTRTAVVVALAIGAFLAGRPTALVGQEQGLGIGRLDALAAQTYAKDSIGGFSVGVVRGARLVWLAGYGYADQQNEVLADVRTVYRVGSITKPFTALMLLQSVERGVVRFADPVSRYLPEIGRVHHGSTRVPSVTLLQLATMTSGLAREPKEEGPFWTGPVADWRSVTTEALAHTEFAYYPGTRMLYSNIGYAVLGAALESAVGVSFIRYQHEQILGPLGMTSSAFEPSDEIRGRLARGYHVRDDGIVDREGPEREHQGRGYKVPNGALYTSVVDLARYVAFMLGHGPNQVLPTSALSRAFAGIVASSTSLNGGYGLGFQAYHRKGLAYVGHGGGVLGYRASMLYQRERDIGVIVLSNRTGNLKGEIGPLAHDMMAVLLGEGDAGSP